jgi:hypothetical protein
MTINDILLWDRQEFLPVELATSDDTILQIIANAIRYWNTHSAFPICRMFPANTSTKRIQMTPDYKNVVQVYPATTPDWILQNYPLWSLLGITIIDNLTSDLIMLSEAFRNYRYYMGTDFKFHYEKSDNPMIGGSLFLSNLPGPSTSIAVVGTKRIVTDKVNVAIVQPGTHGTFPFVPIVPHSATFGDGTISFTDDGHGNLVSSLSGYSGTLDYTTGAWTTTYLFSSPQSSVTYEYNEDITSDYILAWLLYYVKALTKMAEGNVLRKVDAIEIRNDGQDLMNEGKEEKAELEKKLNVEGRWLSFIKRF